MMTYPEQMRSTCAIPADPETLLRRTACAEALSARGYPTSDKTLATKASRGGGPPYRSFGRIPLYRWGDALAWAEGRLSAVRRSSSEGDVQMAPFTVASSGES
jgi:hypothetical protein